MQTRQNENYHLAIDLFVERLNRESIFGGHEEPAVTADTVKLALGELFDIWPESARPDNEANRVVRFRPRAS